MGVTARLALALVLGFAVASVSLASTTRTTVRHGRPPAPGKEVAPIYHGKFADPRWGGSIDLALTFDGRTIQNIGGIAPGVCEDKDFGHLVAGKDGATGPIFEIYLPAHIGANGSFRASQRKAGQRSPFKPRVSATVSGTFDGDTVRGELRASTTTKFDACTAHASFKARRIQ
jgi:hypothetical protein